MHTSRGTFIVVCAPSGSGKSTIIREAMQTLNQLEFSISACTRAPRPGETHGIHYYFLSKSEFEEKINQNAFIEWEMVYQDLYYGTLHSEIDRIISLSKIPLLDIDVQGAKTIKQKFPNDSTVIFIAPPTFEILKQRLIDRNTETDESLAKRLSKYNEEMQSSTEFDYMIINDVLENSVSEFIRIVKNLNM